jgi:hypothetical protein
MLQLPTEFEWEVYAKWSEIYSACSTLYWLAVSDLTLVACLDSDILHVDAAGSSIIIVNSWKAANDLFEKKSSVYSSRYVNT